MNTQNNKQKIEHNSSQKLKQKLKHNPTSKTKHKARNIIWTMFGIILIAGLAIATTTITENTISSENVTAEKINEVLYVDAGVGSDIQVKIDMCPTTGCTVILPSSETEYILTQTLNLTSNLTLIINSGASLKMSGATLYNQTSAHGDVVGFMIYGNNTDNVQILNYGKLRTGSSQAGLDYSLGIFIDNSENIKVLGGDYSSIVAIMNSNYTEVYSMDKRKKWKP